MHYFCIRFVVGFKSKCVVFQAYIQQVRLEVCERLSEGTLAVTRMGSEGFSFKVCSGSWAGKVCVSCGVLSRPEWAVVSHCILLCAMCKCVNV